MLRRTPSFPRLTAAAQDPEGVSRGRLVSRPVRTRLLLGFVSHTGWFGDVRADFSGGTRPHLTGLSWIPLDSQRPDTLLGILGDVAEWLRSGLQSRLHRFDSGRRLLETFR